MGKPDNQPAAEKSMIKPYKEEKPYDLALLDRRPDDLASLVEMNLLRRMRASSPYGASSDTLKPRGRGQKVGPIDRGVRRSIYVFA